MISSVPIESTIIVLPSRWMTLISSIVWFTWFDEITPRFNKIETAYAIAADIINCLLYYLMKQKYNGPIEDVWTLFFVFNMNCQ